MEEENTQQLGKRNTPEDAAPVPGSVAGRLNRSERVLNSSQKHNSIIGISRCNDSYGRPNKYQRCNKIWKENE